MKPLQLCYWITETHNKSFNISLQPNVWQIRHHVSDHLEAGILGQLKGLTDSPYGVATVGVPGYILVDTLNAHLQSGAPVGQHLTVCSRM